MAKLTFTLPNGVTLNSDVSPEELPSFLAALQATGSPTLEVPSPPMAEPTPEPVPVAPTETNGRVLSREERLAQELVSIYFAGGPIQESAIDALPIPSKDLPKGSYLVQMSHPYDIVVLVDRFGFRSRAPRSNGPREGKEANPNLKFPTRFIGRLDPSTGTIKFPDFTPGTSSCTIPGLTEQIEHRGLKNKSYDPIRLARLDVNRYFEERTAHQRWRVLYEKSRTAEDEYADILASEDVDPEKVARKELGEWIVQHSIYDTEFWKSTDTNRLVELCVPEFISTPSGGMFLRIPSFNPPGGVYDCSYDDHYARQHHPNWVKPKIPAGPRFPIPVRFQKYFKTDLGRHVIHYTLKDADGAQESRLDRYFIIERGVVRQASRVDITHYRQGEFRTLNGSTQLQN